ncbi:MAG: S-adenosylmethionine decarboxylase [Oxalobacteraceae bacterium]|nr:MAG: S-adenosylmethionine decarboxylase [Oxalobacteraceae bacterium]
MLPDVRHQHLIVRAEIEHPPIGQDEAHVVEEWMRALIDRIGMKIMFGPQAMYCEVEGNRGMTAFAIIETSHLAFHSWDEMDTAILQLDVYTCSHLKVQDVIDSLDQFDPVKVEYKFLDREHDLKLVSEKNHA